MKHLGRGNFSGFGWLLEAISSRGDKIIKAHLKFDLYLEVESTDYAAITEEGLDFCLSGYPSLVGSSVDTEAGKMLVDSLFLYSGEVSHEYSIDVDVTREFLERIAGAAHDSQIFDLFLSGYPHIDSHGGGEGGGLLEWYVPNIQAAVILENCTPRAFRLRESSKCLDNCDVSFSCLIDLAKSVRSGQVFSGEGNPSLGKLLKDGCGNLVGHLSKECMDSLGRVLIVCEKDEAFRERLDLFFDSLLEVLPAVDRAAHLLSFIMEEHGIPSPANMDLDDTGWCWKGCMPDKAFPLLDERIPASEVEKYSCFGIQAEFTAR